MSRRIINPSNHTFDALDRATLVEALKAQSMHLDRELSKPKYRAGTLNRAAKERFESELARIDDLIAALDV